MKDSKGRMTKQRRIILEQLRCTHNHPTAEELYIEVRKQLPHISLGTVYRNLEVLVTSGEVRQLNLAGSVRRFDGNLDPHSHVRCLGCGRVGDVSIIPQHMIGADQFHAEGFEVTGYQLDFFGFCDDCRHKH